jgi:hypothetical protein
MSWFLRVLLIALPLLAFTFGYVGSRLGAAIRTLTPWPRASVRRMMTGIIAFINLYLILLLAAQIFQWTSFIAALRGGSSWGHLLAYPFWGGLILFAELLPLFLVMDLARLPLWRIFQRHKNQWLKYQALASVILVAGFGIYVGIRIVKDTFSVRLSQREVVIAGLPEELDGFRIVHLSDLQADPHTDAKKMQRYVDLANAQHPDLVLFSGDVVTGGTDYLNAGAKMMGKLRARLGVYACQGDHDYWASRTQVAEALQRAGVQVYEDSVLTLSGSASALSLTILTNVYQRRPAAQKLQQLSEQRPEAAAHLILTHQPTDSIVSFAEKNGYDLVAAGHTHGGQVVFRPFGFPLNVSLFETKHFSGFYQFGKTLLSVTNGLGLTVAPVRYQAPAEVTLLILRRNKK